VTAPVPPEPQTATLWLNARRRAVPLGESLSLLALLDAAGVSYRLHARRWRDPALAGERLLESVDDLAAPLEIVVNGRLAKVGVAHLSVAPGDEVVIGQPDYLRARFSFFV
jgi:hypothetical protein